MLAHLVVSAVVLAFVSGISVSRDVNDDFSWSMHSGRPSVEAQQIVAQHVQLVLSKKLFSLPPQEVKFISEHLARLCDEYRFDPAFILSVIQVESDFRPDAVSPMGAVGLMQLMPATANVVIREMQLPLALKELSPRLLIDPFVNLTVGVAYLAQLREHYEQLGSPYYLLAAYNIGPARMDELLSRKDFKPDKTRKYYEAVRQGASQFRTYWGSQRLTQS